MNSEIDKLGKQMPFTVPEGFFDEMTTNIGQAVEKEQRKAQRASIIKWSMSAAAAATVAVITLLAIRPTTTASDQQLVASIHETPEAYMTDEDLDTWVAITSSDEFLYCNNEIETYY